MFAIKINTDNFITNPYFNILLKLISVNDNKIEETMIGLEPCTKLHFPYNS